MARQPKIYTCPQCARPCVSSDFYGGILTKSYFPTCKTCRKHKIRYPHRSEGGNYAASYKREHPCIDCGEADPVVLDFDHVRGRKLFSLSSAAARKVGLAVVMAEIAKCDIRCSNCHRRRHADQKRRPIPRDDAWKAAVYGSDQAEPIELPGVSLDYLLDWSI